jgi:tetratricopeptide (TPR) repeat protein
MESVRADSMRPTRRRAVYLRPEARERLLEALTARWQAAAPKRRLTRELRADLLGVSLATAERLLRGEGVDRATLALAFRSCHLELRDSDYSTEPPGAEPPGAEPPEAVAPEPPVSMAVPAAPAPRASSHLQAARRPALLAGIGLLLALAAFALKAPGRAPSVPEWRQDFDATYQRGLDHYHHGRLDEAQLHLDRALTLSRANDSAYGFTYALRLAGDLAYARGRYAEAEALFLECLQARRRLSGERYTAELWEAIGNVQLRRGRLAEARASMAKSLAAHEASDHEVGMAMASRGLGSVAYEEGDLRAAREWFRRALAHLQGMNEPGMVVDLRGRLALIRHKEGRSEEALADLQTCLHYWKAQRALRWIALLELEIARVAADTGARQLAEQYAARSLDGFRKIGDRGNEAAAREFLVDVRGPGEGPTASTLGARARVARGG